MASTSCQPCLEKGRPSLEIELGLRPPRAAGASHLTHFPRNQEVAASLVPDTTLVPAPCEQWREGRLRVTWGLFIPLHNSLCPLPVFHMSVLFPFCPAVTAPVCPVDLTWQMAAFLSFLKLRGAGRALTGWPRAGHLRGCVKVGLLLCLEGLQAFTL